MRAGDVVSVNVIDVPMQTVASPASVVLGRQQYDVALRRMLDLQRARIAGDAQDTILYLEHEPVITYGRSTNPAELHRRAHNIPLVEVGRGGQATYHGPGQLIGYCVIELSRRSNGRSPDIHEFIRALEQGLISFLCSEAEVAACLRPGHTGVWIDAEPPRKIVSIGISARRWVTAHGFALNVAPDLEAFENIIPCGDADCDVTSVQRECDISGRAFQQPPLETLAAAVHPHIVEALQSAGYCSA